MNAKPDVINEIKSWGRSAQENLKSAKAASSEVKKIVGLSKHPELLTKYLFGVIEKSTHVFQLKSRRYIKVIIISFGLYCGLSTIGFLARFSNIEFL